LNYYETEPDVIELMTEEEAEKKGLVYMSGLEAVLRREPPSNELLQNQKGTNQ